MMKNSKIFDSLALFLERGEHPEPPEEYRGGDILSFFTFVKGTRPEFPACAVLEAGNGVLRAYALMKDIDIYSGAEKNNEKTWLLGDVFEMFLKFPGHDDYYEFHVTPAGRTLQLHIPDCVTFRDVPFDCQICERHIRAEASVQPEKNMWRAVLEIPFGGNGCAAEKIPDVFTFAFGRYDYTHGVEEPAISATCRFTKTFHTPELWHTFRS